MKRRDKPRNGVMAQLVHSVHLSFQDSSIIVLYVKTMSEQAHRITRDQEISASVKLGVQDFVPGYRLIVDLKF